jgi:hypothetical protein
VDVAPLVAVAVLTEEATALLPCAVVTAVRLAATHLAVAATGAATVVAVVAEATSRTEQRLFRTTISTCSVLRSQYWQTQHHEVGLKRQGITPHPRRKRLWQKQVKRKGGFDEARQGEERDLLLACVLLLPVLRFVFAIALTRFEKIKGKRQGMGVPSERSHKKIYCHV